MWHKYVACLNCGATERPHRSKGYCNKCYGPATQLAEVRRWDQSRPETLRLYPGYPLLDSDNDFESLRDGFAS
jgi:hypothetical protein